MKSLKALLVCSVALALLALGGGCNFAPHYTPPPIVVPPAYKENANWKQAQPNDAMLKGQWWRMFNDPLLNSLEEKVAISNQNVASALQNFFAARALVKEARAAEYPAVSVDPAYTRTHPPSSGTPTQVAGSPALLSNTRSTYNSYSLPADASWEPDIWGLVRNTVRSDAYAAQASAATLENLKLTEQADLAIDYFELRGQDEMIQLFNDTLKAYRGSLDLTTTLYQTGIYTALNVAQADALLQTTLAQATALEIQRAQYEHAIAVLIGQMPSTFSINPSRLTNEPPPIPVGLPSALLERRPDIATAERTTAAANAQIGVARAAYFPTITLSGSAGLESTKISELFTPSSFFWSLGATASETIFDAGRRNAAKDQAWANFRAQAANYREVVLTAFQQVEDSLAALRILGRENQQQAVAVAANQKNLDLSVEQFRLGIASYLNVINAQTSLLANQETAVSLRTLQFTSAVQLVTALGGGWTNSFLPSPTSLTLKNTPN
jgi:NodT family efflux transporter outer membrane factor (OMF) lipoprotein